MEERRRVYGAFMSMRATSVTEPSDTPVVYLQFYDASPTSTHMTAPLVAFAREDVLNEFDGDAELVRWLLHQLSTYEPTCQCVVGLVFNRRTILSDVLVAARRPH